MNEYVLKAREMQLKKFDGSTQVRDPNAAAQAPPAPSLPAVANNNTQSQPPDPTVDAFTQGRVKTTGSQYLGDVGRGIASKLGNLPGVRGARNFVNNLARTGQQERYGINQTRQNIMANRQKDFTRKLGPKQLASDAAKSGQAINQNDADVADADMQERDAMMAGMQGQQMAQNQQLINDPAAQAARASKVAEATKQSNKKGGIGMNPLALFGTLGMSGIAQGLYNRGQRQQGKDKLEGYSRGDFSKSLSNTIETIELRKSFQVKNETGALRNARR